MQTHQQLEILQNTTAAPSLLYFHWVLDPVSTAADVYLHRVMINLQFSALMQRMEMTTFPGMRDAIRQASATQSAMQVCKWCALTDMASCLDTSYDHRAICHKQSLTAWFQKTRSIHVLLAAHVTNSVISCWLAAMLELLPSAISVTQMGLLYVLYSELRSL